MTATLLFHRTDKGANDEDSPLSGFYDGNGIRIPSAGSWRIKAVAMHPSMLPSPPACAVIECLPPPSPAPEPVKDAAAGRGHAPGKAGAGDAGMGSPGKTGAAVTEIVPVKEGAGAHEAGPREGAGSVGVRVRVPGGGGPGSRSARARGPSSPANRFSASKRDATAWTVDSFVADDKAVRFWATWLVFGGLVALFFYRLILG